MHRRDPGGTADSAAESFAGLSLADVLDARDAYHVHLVRQRHVVATAVGRYLVRLDDDHGNGQPLSLTERLALPPGERPARTLQNSSVRPWSWPCVLVFVDDWMGAEEIRRAPDQMVPRRLYLPDGRMVPTCVVYAPPVSVAVTDAELTPVTLSFPSTLFGGYVCVTQVQGQQRVGTIALHRHRDSCRGTPVRPGPRSGPCHGCLKVPVRTTYLRSRVGRPTRTIPADQCV